MKLKVFSVLVFVACVGNASMDTPLIDREIGQTIVYAEGRLAGNVKSFNLTKLGIMG